MKRIFSLFLVFFLLMSLFPVPAFAGEKQLIPVETDLPGSDELFAGYVEQVFYGGSSTFGTAAGRQLTGDSKRIYDALVPELKKIASGDRSSTIITMGQSATSDGTVYTPEISVAFTGKAPSDSQMMGVVYALLSDLPYDLYWFDKTSGFYYSPVVSASGTLKYIELGFSAAGSYRVSEYKTNTAKTSAAAKAAANARSIVSRYASASDYDKLLGYCTEICGLTSYNYSAAESLFTPYGDPWQLIHVFDGEPSTKVVCEGYAKAFLYLCDLSSFSGDTVAYTVGGWMNNGAHMWNTVTIGGKNYLVDVTNQDIGHDLFLVGGSGSVTGGYSVKGFRYAYDSHTKNLWGTGSDSILTLSKSDYSPHSYGSWIQVKAPTLVSPGSEKRTCSVCGHTETRALEALGLSAPAISISVNTATGKPRLKWAAVADAQYYRIYRSTSKSGSYKYLKTTSSTSYTDTTAQAGKNYYYRVRSLNQDYDILSGYSNTVNRACDLPKPDVTMKVQTATGKPKLTWEDLSGAISYRIYRATSKDGSYSLLKTTTSTTFVDTSAEAGINYYYKVTAVHSNSSANSAYSDIVNRMCDLPKPVVSITRKNGDPRITWKAIPDAEKYYVYRATSKDGKYTKVKTTVTATSYTDTSAKAGTTYYYKVKAIHAKSSANSAYSEIRYITAK